ASARQQLERICVFLGVPYSAKMLDYVADSTYSAPDPGASYQWKTGLRAADVQRIEAKLADRLLRRGYAMSGLPRKSIGRTAKTYLRLHSRVNAYLLRVRRFGIALTLRETLTRRFGFQQAHQDAVGRIDRIINANVK